MKLKLYHILLFTVILGYSTKVTAQTLTIKEIDSNITLPGITIYNTDKSKNGITDLNGEVNVTSFTNSETIIIKSLIYETLRIKKSALLNTDFIIFLTPKTEGLNQVVISASKFKQNKKDIPQKITSLSAKDVLLTNPQTSADLLNTAGNVFIQKSQLGGGSPMIRGFSTNRLLINIDGVRLNNAIFRGGNVQNVISIDPLSIANTEVTLGAGSVVYGSDAIGGVMSFYTQKPQLSFTNNIKFNSNIISRYSSANNEKTGHFDVNLGFKNWAFLTNVTYNDFGDLRMGSHGPERYLRPFYVARQNGEDIILQNPDPKVQKPTGYNQINVLQKILYKPSDNYFFNLGVYFTKTSNYPRYDRLLRPRNETLRSAEWQYGPQQWFMTNLQYTKYSSSSNLYDKVQSTIAFQNFKESRNDRDFMSPLREVREENVDIISFNLDLEKRVSEKSSLFYGVEYLYNKVGSKSREINIDNNTSVPNVTRYPNGSTWQSMAIYTSYKYKPNAKFVFQSGLRYSHVLADANFEENNVFLNLPFNSTKINTGALTGTAGVSFSPNKTIQWRLNGSTAFRAPNIDNIGKVFDSEPGSVVVPNNNLKSEYAVGGELGLKLNFDDFITFDLSSYYTFLDRALIQRDFTLNGETEIIYDGELSNVQAIQNASKAWIYGLEAGVEIKFSKKLTLNTQYNIIGGTEENNGIEVPVRHVAPQFGRTLLRYKLKTFLIEGFLVYNGELSHNQLAPSELSKEYLYDLDENGNPFSPSWYTLNLRSQFNISKAFSVTTSLENITDQRYRPYSSGISAPGRNFILSLKYSI